MAEVSSGNYANRSSKTGHGLPSRRSGWAEYRPPLPLEQPRQSRSVISSNTEYSRPRSRSPKAVRDSDSAYITARRVAMSEYDASRIFLEKPEDPTSEHGSRVAAALAHTYNIECHEVRDIWATKAWPGGHLSQWQTDAFPPFFPDVNYPEEERRRVNSRSCLPATYTEETPILWGPTSTTRYMLLDDAPPRLSGTQVSEAMFQGPRMPGHKRHQRQDAAVKSLPCDRGERPPVGHIDVTIVECLNLAVPHKFQNFWNVSSISPFVQVELVERGTSGEEMIQFLKTTTMSRSKMDLFNRSPIDSVYNETCRFQALHLNTSQMHAIVRTNLLVSVIDTESSKCLGSVTIPLIEVLRKRAAPFYTWYELMKPSPTGESLVPVIGSDNKKLSCIHLGFWANPVPEHVALEILDITSRRAEMQAEEVYALYKQVMAERGEDALHLINGKTPLDVQREYDNVKAKQMELEYKVERLNHENLRMAEEEVGLAREERRLAALRLTQHQRKLALEQEADAIVAGRKETGHDSQKSSQQYFLSRNP